MTQKVARMHVTKETSCSDSPKASHTDNWTYLLDPSCLELPASCWDRSINQSDEAGVWTVSAALFHLPQCLLAPFHR